MKKITVIAVFVLGLGFSSLMAQPPGGGNFDAAKMKEHQLQRLKESDLKLTDAQADSVVSINMETMQQMRGFRDLSEDQRSVKMKEMNDYRQKRLTAALQDEALARKVSEYYEKQRANRFAGGQQQQQQQPPQQ